MLTYFAAIKYGLFDDLINPIQKPSTSTATIFSCRIGSSKRKVLSPEIEYFRAKAAKMLVARNPSEPHPKAVPRCLQLPYKLGNIEF
jgi:hypothetical protein